LLLYFLQKSCRKDLRLSWVLSTSFHLSPLTNVLFKGCSAGGKYTPLNQLRGDSLIFCWSDCWLTKEAATAPKGSALPCQCLLPKIAISCLLRPGGVLLLHAAVLGIPGAESV
ncbi:hypothetical protein N320_10052, partial [Buceros rhinoceros silvestris]